MESRIVFVVALSACPAFASAQAIAPDTIAAAKVAVPPLDPLQLLAGRVAGVLVVTAEGDPFNPPDVFLRGAAMRPGRPLFLIDGVISHAGVSGLNPSDIERVEVLKGASAASLYGARAGSGVINIVTRHGNPGRGVSAGLRAEVASPGIEYDQPKAQRTVFLGDENNDRFCVAAAGMPLCSATVSWESELDRINGPAGAPAPAESFIADPLGTWTPAMLANRYQERPFAMGIATPLRQVLRNGMLNQVDGDVTVRTGGTLVHASASRLARPGMIQSVEAFDRYAGSLGVTHRAGRALTVSLRGFVSRMSGDRQRAYDFVVPGLNFLPGRVDLSARDSLGRLYERADPGLGGLQTPNPAVELARRTDDARTSRYDVTARVRWAPRTWVEAEGHVGVNRLQRSVNVLAAPRRVDAIGPLTLVNGATLNASSYGVNILFRRDVGVLRIRPRLGFLAERFDDRDSSGSSGGFGPPGLPGGFPGGTFSRTFLRIQMTGFSAGAALDYGDRYSADVAIRRDGNSLGAPGFTSGRVALAWRVTGEGRRFLSGTISDLRLHAARGSAGGMPNLPHLFELSSSLSALDYVGGGRVTETELGADLELFRRARLRVTHAASEGAHRAPVPLPSEKGFGYEIRDVGRIHSRSWELALEYAILDGGPVRWSWRASYDRNRASYGAMSVPPFTQGGGGAFFVREGERVGALYGRRFATACAELPAAFQSQCGEGRAFQLNDDGYLVWVGTDAQGAAYTWRDGITSNLWGVNLPGAQSPWGVPLNWGAPIIVRDSLCASASSPTCSGMYLPLGSGIPDAQLSLSTSFSWRRLTVYGLLQGTMGRKVWNQARHWAYFQGTSTDLDQNGKTVETAKPRGYYWRAGPGDGQAGYGGLFDMLLANNHFVESADYAKLREVAVSYDIGSPLGAGRWTLTLIGRNLLTFTSYSGLDPEVPVATGLAGEPNATDNFAFPNPRTVGLSVGVRF